MLIKDKSTPENREFWEFVEKTAEEVRSWPDWKRGYPETSDAPSSKAADQHCESDKRTAAGKSSE